MKRKEEFKSSPTKKTCNNTFIISNLNSKIIKNIDSFSTNKNLNYINSNWYTALKKKIPEIIDLTEDEEILEINNSIESISSENNFTTIQFDYFFIDVIDEFKWKWIIGKESFDVNFNYPVFTVEAFITLLNHAQKNPQILKNSRLISLKQMFLILNPFITCCCTSLEEVKYFIETTYSILQKDEQFDDIFLGIEEFKIYPSYEFEKQTNFSIFNFCVESLAKKIISLEDGDYVGEVDEDELPNGKGTWLSDGDLTENYYGFWLNGLKHGYGKYQNQTLVYVGDFENDTFHGEGRLVNTKGTKKGHNYIGSFIKGQREGTGVQYLSGKSYYRGGFKANKRHGSGEYFDQTDWRYGEWKCNLFCDGIGQFFDQEEKQRYALKYQNFEEFNKRCLIPNIKEKEEEHLGPLMSKRTIYNGYYFRSRLEARWGLFFDFLQIRYLYEPKSFNMPNNTTYTPDFYLPDLNIWIEIKPVYPTEEERYRAKELIHLAIFDSSRVFLFYGNVAAPFLNKFNEGAKGIEFKSDSTEIEPVSWCECDKCGKILPELRGQPKCHLDSKDSIIPSNLLKQAYKYANSIDFENDAIPVTIDDSCVKLPEFKKRGKLQIKSKYF